MDIKSKLVFDNKKIEENVKKFKEKQAFREKYMSYGSDEYYMSKYLKYKEKYMQLKGMLQNQ